MSCRMPSWILAGAVLALASGANPRPAVAAAVEEITSPGGIKAWLAADHASPLLSLRFAFAGGSSAEPAERAGITRLMAGVLLAGGGQDDEAAFRKRMQRAGVRIGFQAGRDALYGSADILTAHRPESLALLRAALQQPRFDPSTLMRKRALMLSDLAETANDPRTTANDRWYANAFRDNGYARPPDGDAMAISAITRDDLVRQHARTMRRSTLVVAAAGDISAKEFGELLDRVFGGLAEGPSGAAATADVRPAQPLVHVESGAAPSAIVFGAPAPAPADRDYAASRVVAHVLGSGDLDSRLVGTLRLQAGLVYSAQAGIIHDSRATFLLGELSTGPDKVPAALGALSRTLEQMADEGPSAQEVEAAKSALVGKLLLSVVSTASLADAMLYARLDHAPVDFLRRQQDGLAAVTLQDARRAARDMLSAGHIGVIVVGGASR